MTKLDIHSRVERQLYVEALFKCLDNGAVSTSEALNDLCGLMSSLTVMELTDSETTSFRDYFGAVIRRYQSGQIKQPAAIQDLLSVIDRASDAELSSGRSHSYDN